MRSCMVSHKSIGLSDDTEEDRETRGEIVSTWTSERALVTYREREGVLGSLTRLGGGAHSGAAWRLRLRMGLGIPSIILRIHLRALNVGQVAEAQSAAELATGQPARSLREQLQNNHNHVRTGLAKPTACVSLRICQWW